MVSTVPSATSNYDLYCNNISAAYEKPRDAMNCQYWKNKEFQLQASFNTKVIF